MANSQPLKIYFYVGTTCYYNMHMKVKTTLDSAAILWDLGTKLRSSGLCPRTVYAFMCGCRHKCGV